MTRRAPGWSWPRWPESASTTSADADHRAGTAWSPALTAASPLALPAACGRERGEGLTRIVPFGMLTEQQLAVLRSEPGSNRVAKAMALTGVTQVTVAKALGLTQPYVSDVARGRYRTITVEYRRERLEVRRLLRLPYRGSVPVTPPTVGLNEVGPLRCPLPGRLESHDADPGLDRRDRPRETRWDRTRERLCRRRPRVRSLTERRGCMVWRSMQGAVAAAVVVLRPASA